MAKLGKIAALLAVGLPALLFGPIIVSSIYWFLGVIWGIYVPWTWVLLGSFAVLIPLLFWTEWKSGGSYYTTEVLSRYGQSDDSRPFVTGFSDVDSLVNFVRRPRDPYIGLVELFLWGPRQILEAATTLRDVRGVAAVDRNRAAEILTLLQQRDHVDLKDLVSNGGSNTSAAVSYLVFYDWIGISQDKARVWIETASRDALKR
jgi:hypothetical protein